MLVSQNILKQFPENLGRGVRPASQNPYPIFPLPRFSLPYLWPDQVEEGKAGMGEEGCDEEVASSKRKTELMTRVQKSIPYLWPKWRQNG